MRDNGDGSFTHTTTSTPLLTSTSSQAATTPLDLTQTPCKPCQEVGLSQATKLTASSVSSQGCIQELQYEIPSTASFRMREYSREIDQMPLMTPIHGFCVRLDDVVDGGTSNDKEQVRGVKIGPGLQPRVLYAETEDNCLDAWQRRKVEKAPPCNLTAADHARIEANVSAINHVVYTKKRVREALDDMGLFGSAHFKSGKWSENRFNQSMEMLMGKMEAVFKFKMGIKNEPSNPSKPPRFLLADGDEGQLLSLVTVAVCERIWFHYFEGQNIKYRSKNEAMRDMVKQFNLVGPTDKVGQTIFENDGSAWDSCCNHEIRTAIKNRFIEHVAALIVESGWWMPETWIDVHLGKIKKKKIPIKISKKIPGREQMRKYLETIQESGGRDTTWGNGAPAKVMSECAVLENPYLNADGTPGGLLTNPHKPIKDRWGWMRRWWGKYEGDDCFNATTGGFTDTQKEDILSFWLRCGYLMKLKFADKVAEFCGWKFAILDGRMTGQMMPDLPRLVSNSCISIARDVIDAKPGYEDVIAAKMDCYSRMLWMCPSAQTYFNGLRDEWSSGRSITLTEDMKRQLKYEDDVCGMPRYLRCDYRWEDPIEDCTATDLPFQATPKEEENLLVHLGIVRGSEHYASWSQRIRTLSRDNSTLDMRACGWSEYHK